MNTRKLTITALLIAMLAVPLGTALAKEVGMITVTGPGIKTPIEITDRAFLLDFSENMYDYKAGITTPPAWIAADSPYFELTRSYMDTSKVIAADKVHYYPNPTGGLGAVQYMGMTEGGGYSSETNKWYPMTTGGETSFKNILVKNGVTLASLTAAPAKAGQASPQVAPVALSTPNSPWVIAVAGVALIALLGAGAWLLRSRLTVQRS